MKPKNQLYRKALYFLIIFLLAGCYFSMPYAYYELVRHVLFTAFLFLAYQNWKWNLYFSLIIVLVGAVIFNPIVPFHFSKERWEDIDTWTLMVVLFFFLNREANYDIDPNMKRYKLLKLKREQNLTKIQRKKDSEEFRAKYINDQILEKEALDSLFVGLDRFKVSEQPLNRSALNTYYKHASDIQNFQFPTTDVLKCKADDILLLIGDPSRLFDSKNNFGISDAWLIGEQIDITLTNILSDVPDFIALPPDEVHQDLTLDIHVSNYHKLGDTDQQDFAWKVHPGNCLVWLRPSLNDEGILRVITFKSAAIFTKNEIELKSSPTFESINDLPRELKKSLWDLFKLLKDSAPREKPQLKWKIG